MQTHYFLRKPLPVGYRPHHPAYRGATTDNPGVDIRRILRGPCLQAKLTVGAPDDVYEREAEHIADEVVRMPEPLLQAAPT